MMAARDNINESPQLEKRSIKDDANLSGSLVFVGSAILPIPDGAVHVFALCWPIVSTGWRTLAQTWKSIGEFRQSIDSNATPHPPSWVAECAPQLGTPFRGTTAEESSIAAIFTRTPMCIAVSVLDSDGAPATSEANLRQGLLECLSIYDAYIRVPGRQACSALVTRGANGAVDQGYVDAFARSQRSLDAKWLQDMELRVLNGPRDPLPLEVTHVIAASIARYRVDADLDNPIVDAVRAKLSHRPALLDRPPKRRR
jgi:hypothetical protein